MSAMSTIAVNTKPIFVAGFLSEQTSMLYGGIVLQSLVELALVWTWYMCTIVVLMF